MVRFSKEDEILLYITRATAEELGTGSWDVCTIIFNRLASKPRTQDGLTAAYRSLKRSTKKSKLKARARDATWRATREQVERWLREKKDARPNDLIPRSDRLDSEDSVEMVCPAPQRTLVLPFTEWSGANTQMDLGVHAAFLPQQGALSEEQCWAADGCVSNAALWPVQAAEYPFANGTAAGFDATFMYGAVNKDIEPIYGEDSSATYNAGNWARCGAGGSCLYGAGGSAMYEDNPYFPGAGTSSYIASSPADYAPIPTESLSESSSSSFGQAVPAHTHLQDLDVESTSIMQNFTWQETGGLMSSEQLNSLLERYEPGFHAI
ncbi:uncharacterized protein ALTATR162_LOCUS12084 [Alternaria atra]|uniref:Uncharacterized protein n=1 Tax=Alternaria atra TaxID=119953 RepID=A0A8J2ICP5_9PLEO|nr:uncharacterized protein ALTATR162_LOCUS12084 [Alternaria atra]CAG5189786.1 unnamed protein product [Alternaria atra]